MKKISTYLTWLVLLAIPTLANAYSTYVGEIQVPNGFSEPSVQKIRNDWISYEFRRIRAESNITALFKVIVLNSTKNLDARADDQKIDLIAKYQDQFLSRIQEGNKSITASEPEIIRINGFPATLAHWSGTAQGQEVAGVMCTALVGNSIVNINAFDLAGLEEPFAREADEAIRNAKFENPSTANK